MMAPLFSTSYLPSVAYFAQLSRHEDVTIEIKETFHKQTYRNRTNIVTANGLLSLVVPVVRTDGNHTMTCNIGISYQENWNTRHLRAIESAYSAAPYYIYYMDGIEAILRKKHERLIDLNQELTEYLIKRIKINCKTSFSEDFTIPGTIKNDYRDTYPIKGNYTEDQFPVYDQVFDTKLPFQPNACVLDLLFNLGPDSKRYLSALEV